MGVLRWWKGEIIRMRKLQGLDLDVVLRKDGRFREGFQVGVGSNIFIILFEFLFLLIENFLNQFLLQDRNHRTLAFDKEKTLHRIYRERK